MLHVIKETCFFYGSGIVITNGLHGWWLQFRTAQFGTLYTLLRRRLAQIGLVVSHASCTFTNQPTRNIYYESLKQKEEILNDGYNPGQ